MPFKSILIAGALCLFSAVAAQAKTVRFTATLSGAEQVPPVTTAATGKVIATLDTDEKVLTYIVTYSGLSGPAVAAHFHGPADKGANAPPIVPIDASDLPSPIAGTADMTAAQMGDLTAGKWYFNIHTAANPGGELRALAASPSPAATRAPRRPAG
jgi:hypothetical protein